MPFFGYCVDCPSFVWTTKETDAYREMNKHKRRLGHNRHHSKVWKVNWLVFGFVQRNRHKKWFTAWVQLYVIRNIPTVKGRRHLESIPLT